METIIAWLRHTIKAGFICTQTLPGHDNLADAIVKMQPTTLFKFNARKYMEPFKEFELRLTTGETLRKKRKSLQD